MDDVVRTSSARAVPGVGEALPTRTIGPITRTDIVRYAGVSGDFNPIHHDDAFARDAGFPSVFAMGMLQATMLGVFVAEQLGPENVRRFTARFLDQVWPGDVLQLSGTVTAVTEVEDGVRVDVDLECTRHTGTTAVRASAQFLLP